MGEDKYLTSNWEKQNNSASIQYSLFWVILIPTDTPESPPKAIIPKPAPSSTTDKDASWLQSSRDQINVQMRTAYTVLTKRRAKNTGHEIIPHYLCSERSCIPLWNHGRIEAPQWHNRALEEQQQRLDMAASAGHSRFAESLSLKKAWKREVMEGADGSSFL